jgi:hypothetical protein
VSNTQAFELTITAEAVVTDVDGNVVEQPED